MRRFQALLDITTLTPTHIVGATKVVQPCSPFFFPQDPATCTVRVGIMILIHIFGMMRSGNPWEFRKRMQLSEALPGPKDSSSKPENRQPYPQRSGRVGRAPAPLDDLIFGPSRAQRTHATQPEGGP